MLTSLQYHWCTAEAHTHTLSQNLCWPQKPDNNVRGRVQTWGLAPAVSWLELWDEASPWLSEGNQEYASRGNHTCLQEKTKPNVYDRWWSLDTQLHAIQLWLFEYKLSFHPFTLFSKCQFHYFRLLVFSNKPQNRTYDWPKTRIQQLHPMGTHSLCGWYPRPTPWLKCCLCWTSCPSEQQNSTLSGIHPGE